MRTILSLTIFIHVISNTLISQVCTFDIMYEEKVNSGVANQNEIDYEASYIPFMLNPITSGSYNIPIVAHVLEQNGYEPITNEQIVESIQLLNSQFANSGLSNVNFYLAGIDPLGDCSTGIERYNIGSQILNSDDADWKENYEWDRNLYLNIYVSYLFASSTNLGYGTPPFLISQGDYGDGVVIKASAMGNTGLAVNNEFVGTLAHEVGHYLGLLHVGHRTPWYLLGAGACNDCEGFHLLDGSSYDPMDPAHFKGYRKGDRINDTDPVYQEGTSPTCGLPMDQCSDEPCSKPINDFEYPAYNYLSTYTSECHVGFTSEQRLRMYYSLRDHRISLWDQSLTVSCLWDSSDENITGDVVWSNASSDCFFRKGHDVYVKSGAKLTIPSDVIVQFGPGKGIFVESGATLELYGTITSCDGQWKGISVNGPGARLSSTGGMIENANLAVSVKSGGYCSAISTMFLNNTWGVEVNFSSNGGSFEDCAFEVNQDFQGDYFSYHMRIISNADQVKVRGGYFINSWDERSGTAINSYNGNFTVAPSYDYDKFGDLQGTNKTRFTGFHHGIDAHNGITFSYQVENSIFDKNNIAIYNNEVNSSKITFNEFNIDDDQVGVMYHGSTVGLINQENRYIGLSDNDNVGVLSKSIGVMNNTIRRNTFDNLENGCLANGLNGENPQVPRGLTFLCNTNQNVIIDHAVADDPLTQLDQINPVQGDRINTNEFNVTGNIIHYDNVISSDFYNAGDLNIEYHSRDIVGERLVTSVGVNEITQPNQNYKCDQNIFIDFPPIIADPQDPHFPTDLIGMKEYLDSINGGPGTGGPNPGPVVLFEQEEWDYCLPFILNEVMVMNQDDAYAGFLNSNQFTLSTHELNVVSWIYGHSLEGDLTIVRILAENGQNNQASNYLNTLSSLWNNHPQITSALADYTDILNEIGTNRVGDLTINAVNNLVNDYSIIRTGFGEAWIRSIAEFHGIHIPITYTLPLSGQVAPRNINSNIESSIWPNPFTETFTFKASTNGILEIYDILGREVKNVTLERGEFKIELNPERSGIYFYQFRQGDTIYSSGKLIKL